MYGRKAQNAYRNVQFSTVDRGRLLLMMYDGLLKFLRLAKESLEQRDIPKFARFLSKSQAVISELANTLDFEKGGEIARDLDRIYDFSMFYLTEANLQKDPTKIERVINIISTIHTAYKEIIETGKAEKELAAQNMWNAPGERTASSAPARETNKEDAPSAEHAPKLRVAL